jgi:flagellar hook-associated protein 1 FlgK
MSDFVALYTAFSGLRAAQTAMDTASHNVANAANPGYTRQRVELATHQPSYRRSGYIGTGVDVTDITRARNAFLDDRFRASAGAEGRLATLGDMLDGVEAAMGEPDHGLTAGLGGLWAAFEDLALDPTDTAARLAVISTLDSVVGRIRTVAEAWDASGATAASDIAVRVTEANRLLEQVAKLNGEIVAATAAGGSPNDLLDARDVALDRLATLAGTTATITESGTARVSINGLALVHDLQVSRLSYDAGTNTILHASGATVRPGGQIAGLHGFLATDLPQMRTSLDDLAAALADALNTRHAAGFTPAGAAGGPLLSYVPGDAALTLSVAVSNPTELAAAGTAPVAEFDGVNAEALAALRLDLAAAGGTQTLDEAARSLVTSVAQSFASAQSSMASQTALTQAAEAARTQAHGVSIDEEMVDLVTYQRAYEAAARVMTTVDEALDVLINRTGIVGR